MTNPSTRIESTLGGWRTIESAPKDGADILAWCYDRAVVTFWGEIMARDDGSEGWILSYDGADPLYHALPTHWMPLPPPPPGEQPSVIEQRPKLHGWGLDIPPEFSVKR